ncbi:MAG: hypothetical protein AB7P04_03405 [Bacteriovoracia bacterium]
MQPYIQSFLKFALPVALISSLGTAAHADFTYDPAQLSALTTSLKDAMLKTAGYQTEHRSYRSATPLGVALGLDVGVDVTLVSFSDDFRSALTTVGNSGSNSSSLPLPRLNIHKGLPAGIDLGFSWIAYGGYSLIGFDLQWAFVRSPMLSLAARTSYTKAKLSYINSNTLSFDVLGSLPIGIIDPYLGFGLQTARGSLNFDTGTLPISGDGSYAAGHLFFGLPIKLFILKLTAEYNMNFSGYSTYGAKLSFAL